MINIDEMVGLWRRDWLRATRQRATKVERAYPTGGRLEQMCRIHAAALRAAANAFDIEWKRGMDQLVDLEKF